MALGFRTGGFVDWWDGVLVGRGLGVSLARQWVHGWIDVYMSLTGRLWESERENPSER